MPNNKRVMTPEEMREAAAELSNAVASARWRAPRSAEKGGAAALEAVAGQVVVGHFCQRCFKFFRQPGHGTTKMDCGGTLVPVGEIVKVEVGG